MNDRASWFLLGIAYGVCAIWLLRRLTPAPIPASSSIPLVPLDPDECFTCTVRENELKARGHTHVPAPVRARTTAKSK